MFDVRCYIVLHYYYILLLYLILYSSFSSFPSQILFPSLLFYSILCSILLFIPFYFLPITSPPLPFSPNIPLPLPLFLFSSFLLSSFQSQSSPSSPLSQSISSSFKVYVSALGYTYLYSSILQIYLQFCSPLLFN